jgi:hypothetical protein
VQRAGSCRGSRVLERLDALWTRTRGLFGPLGAVSALAFGLLGVAMSAPGVQLPDGVELGEVVIRLRDRGLEPAWHEDRGLFGAWCRYEAELVGYSVVRELGLTPWEAVHRLVSNHRPVLERRWGSGGLET